MSLLERLKQLFKRHREIVINHPFVQDVLLVHGAKILDLHARVMRGEYNKPAKDFLTMHWHVITAAVCLVVMLANTIYSHPSHASITQISFFPGTCESLSTDASHMSGHSDLTDGAFTAENSTILEDEKPVTCQTYATTEEIPLGSSIKTVTLRFSWKLAPTQADETTVSEPTESSTPVEESADTITPDVITPDSTPDVNTGTDDTVSFRDSLKSFFAPAKVFAQEADAPAPEPAPTADAAPVSESTVTPDTVPVIDPVSTPEPAPEPAPETAPDTVVSEPASTPQDTTPDSTASSPEETVAPTETSGASDPATDPVPETAPVTEPAPEPVIEPAQVAKPLVRVEYSLDGEVWKTAGTATVDNWQVGSFELNDPDITVWQDIANLQVRIEKIGNNDEGTPLYVDASTIDVSYETLPDEEKLPVIKLKESLDIFSGDQDFDPSANPSFTINDPSLSTREVKRLIREEKAEVVEDKAGVFDESSSLFSIFSWVAPKVAYADEPVQITDAVLVDSAGEVADVRVLIETVTVDGVEKQKISIIKPERAFRPGRYTLRISLQTPEVIVITEQDFTWGVLSINPDKSIYHPGNDVYLQMGVLNETGHTLCGASLSLKITSPSGNEKIIGTDTGEIVRNPDCSGDTVISDPDYSAHILASEVGVYNLTLTAYTDNGEKIIHDRFEVDPLVTFDVSRTGPTRIFPVAAYPVTIRVTPTEDWSGTITETVPASFEIDQPARSEQYTDVSIQDETKIISWNVTLKAGEETTLGYYFDAPDISPEFYLLGPLRFIKDGTEVFHENREWQIASDATCSATTTGNWNTGANWSGCSGAGGIPATGDNITINSGVTITMNVASPVLGTITVNGTLNTSDGTSRALSGTTLTIGSTGTLTANASTITLSGTTGTPLTLTAGGMFNAGTSTIALTGNNGAGNTTVSKDFSYYNLTINNSAETFVLEGTTTVNAAGTLTITNGTLNTTASNYTLNAGKISLATSAATCVLTANASTINLTATSGLLFSRSASAVFNAGTSTVALTGNGDATFNSGNATTFYNVTSSGTGTKTLGLALTLSAAGTLSITNGTFSTGASNLALSVGHIDVQAGGTLTLNTSTMTLTTTDGDPVLSTAGTFSNTAFTVTYTGINASGDTIIGSGIPYYNLTLNGSGEVYVLEGSTTVSAAGTLTVSAGTLNTTTSNYALSAGKISAANTAVAILTFNGSTVSLTATSGTVFPKSSGAVFNAGTSTVDLTGNGDITLTGAVTVSFYNLKISGTGTKSMAVATTVTNVLSITAGTLTTTASNFALTIGNLDLQSGGTLTLNASALTLTGTDGDPVDAIAGTINIGTSTIIYNGNNSSGNTIVSKDISYYNLTVNNSAETYELEGVTTVSASGTLNIANGTFTTTASNYTLSAGKISLANASTAILTLNGSTVNLTAVSGSLFSRSGGSGVLNAGTSTVVIAADGDQTILAGVAPTFYNMTIASTGTKSLGATLTVSNTLSVTSGTLTTVTNLAVTAGTLSIGSGGTFLANASAVTLNGTSGTPLSNAGTFNTGTSTVNYTGNNAGGNTTIDMHVTYYNLTLNNASETFVPEGDFVVSASGTLTVTAGTFDTTGSNYSLSTGKIFIPNSASAIVTLNASTVTLTATSGILLTKGGNGVFTAGTSNVILGGDGDATVNSGVVAFYNLTSSGTGTKTIGATFSVTNNLVISNGTFSAPTSTTLPVGTMDVQSGATLSLTATTVTVSGTNGNPFSAAGTVNMGTSTFVFTGNNPSGNTIIHSGVAYYNLTINNSAETYVLEGATTVDTAATLTITNGTLDTTSSNYQLTFGKLVIASASTAIFNMNDSLIVATSTGTAISKGTLGVMNPGTSEVQLTGAGNTNLNGTYYDLVVAGSGTKNTGATGATVNHDLTIASGIWNGTTSTITGSGTNTIHVQSGAVLQIGASSFSAVIISFETRDMQAGSTVEYLGGTQTVDSTITYAGLKITTIGTKSLNGPTTATETVNINTNATLTTTASNYALNAGSISIDGTSTLTANASTITVSGSWTNSGTFTQGTSTVVFNTGTTAVITGTTTFYNLTITHTAAKTVNFATTGSPQYDVSHTFTVTGHTDELIKLYSDSDGTQWIFHPTGTATVDYVDVKDGACASGAITITPSNSISSGNNDSCWNITNTQTLTMSLSDNSVGFGTLSAGAPRFCTANGLGSSSEVEGFTISVATNAASGYTLSVKGATLTSGSNTIAAIGGTNTASSPGTAQFGLRSTASGGNGSVSSPYAASGFAYAATASTPSVIGSSSSGDGVTTTYSLRCLANMSPVTAAGSYSTNLTYVVTANF